MIRQITAAGREFVRLGDKFRMPLLAIGGPDVSSVSILSSICSPILASPFQRPSTGPDRPNPVRRYQSDTINLIGKKPGAIVLGASHPVDTPRPGR